MMASSGFYLDEFSAGTRHANAVLEDESLDPMSASIFGALPATHRPNTGPEASDDHGLRGRFYDSNDGRGLETPGRLAVFAPLTREWMRSLPLRMDLPNLGVDRFCRILAIDAAAAVLWVRA